MQLLLLLGVLFVLAPSARGELALGFYTWSGDSIPRALDPKVFPYLIPYGSDGLLKKGRLPAYLRKHGDFRILFSLKDTFRESPWYSDPPGCAQLKDEALVIACLVKKLDTLPQIAGWYLVDEPTFTMKRNRFGRIHAASRAIAEISSKPIFIEDFRKSASWDSLVLSGDVLMTSSYPVPQGDYTDAFRVFRDLRAKAKGKKVWAVLQTFDRGDYREKREPYHRLPTLAEIRLLSHLAVAAGVEGIVYFSLRDASKYGEGFLDGPMRDLGIELKAFHAWLRTETPEIILEEDSGVVRGLSRGHEGFVINSRRENSVGHHPLGSDGRQVMLEPMGVWKADAIPR